MLYGVQGTDKVEQQHARLIQIFGKFQGDFFCDVWGAGQKVEVGQHAHLVQINYFENAVTALLWNALPSRSVA